MCSNENIMREYSLGISTRYIFMAFATIAKSDERGNAIVRGITQKKLGARFGVSEATIIKAIKELGERDLMRYDREKGRQPNIYYLNPDYMKGGQDG